MSASSNNWLNRNVIGMTITSFCADVCYEMVSAVLPGFLGSIGVAAAALGWIEGASDALASGLKLGVGWYSDRIGRRKPLVALGYFLSGTALSVFALAVSWPLVLAGRLVAWFGKGIRKPLRDALLAESTPPGARGKVFGLHRAGDTAGAVLGPLIGVWLLSRLPRPDPSAPFRTVFLVSLIPGLIAFASVLFLVKETPAAGDRARRFRASLRELPAPFTRFLVSVGLFGAGDFAPTLLVLAAAQLLAPAYGVVRAGELAALCYVVRNIVYAAISFPAGALGDRGNKEKILAGGYALGGLTAIATAWLFVTRSSSLIEIGAVFVLAGAYVGIQDALEGAIPADLIEAPQRGTAYGVMGGVNGIGDLIASAMVGTLWTLVSPQFAFGCAAALMLAGAALLYFLAANTPSQTAP